MDDEIELTESGAVVAGDKRVVEPQQVLKSELLACKAESVTGIGGHDSDRMRLSVPSQHPGCDGSRVDLRRLSGALKAGTDVDWACREVVTKRGSRVTRRSVASSTCLPAS